MRIHPLHCLQKVQISSWSLMLISCFRGGGASLCSLCNSKCLFPSILLECPYFEIFCVSLSPCNPPFYYLRCANTDKEFKLLHILHHGHRVTFKTHNGQFNSANFPTSQFPFYVSPQPEQCTMCDLCISVILFKMLLFRVSGPGIQIPQSSNQVHSRNYLFLSPSAYCSGLSAQYLFTSLHWWRYTAVFLRVPSQGEGKTDMTYVEHWGQGFRDQ